MKFPFVLSCLLFFCIALNAQPPSNVGCMLNENGQLRMYYGTPTKVTQGNTYRYVYSANTYYVYSEGVSCPPDKKYFKFGDFYTERNVRIGCHRNSNFSGPLGEMRYFMVYNCPLDDYLIPLLLSGVAIVFWFSKRKQLNTR